MLPIPPAVVSAAGSSTAPPSAEARLRASPGRALTSELLLTGRRATVEEVRTARRRLDAAALVDADDVYAAVCSHPDFHEGVAAFLEHRRPRWSTP